MQINISYDSSVNPGNFTGGALEMGAFQTAMTYVVNLFDTMFTNNVSVNVDVGWGEFDGQGLKGNALGENTDNDGEYDYATVRNALINNANYFGQANQIEAYSNLPTSWPSPMFLNTAEAKAIGVWSGNASDVDGWMGFSSNTNWSFAPGVTPAGGVWYFIGVAEHELSEILGRVGGAGSFMGMFRYSAPGVLWGGGNTNYFSIDDGKTNLGTWNNNPNNGQDLGDWAIGPAPGANDAFNAASNGNAVNALSLSDVTLMNVLGWDIATAPNQIGVGVTGFVSGGLPNQDLIVLSGGALVVGIGGDAIGAQVRDGGYMQVNSNGRADGAIVGTGASMQVMSGGEADGTVLASTGQLQVDSGATASGTDFFGGGNETVFGADHAAILNGQIGADGVQTISSGATAMNSQIDAYGLQIVAAGGLALGVTINSGGVEDVNLSGTTLGTTVDSGGIETVTGSDISTTVNVGGEIYVGWISDAGPAGGSSFNNTVNGGEQDVVGFGTASGTVISAGYENVYSGGTETSATVGSGGNQVVYAGGTVNDTIVSSGGTITVSNGGLANSVTIEDGGKATLEQSTTVAGLEVENGATLEIGAGYRLQGLSLGSGSYLLVDSGGTAAGTKLHIAWENVASGGMVDNQSLDYALQSIDKGGVAGGTVLTDQAEQYDNGTAINTTINGSGTFQQVDGVARTTTVNFEADQYVDAGGLAVATTVNYGGSQTVMGTARATTVNSSGEEVISVGGVASATTLSGGQQDIYSGTAQGTTVDGVGTQIVHGGGTAVRTFIGQGSQVVSSAGVADGATVSGQYSFQVVAAGGLVSATTVEGGSQQFVGGGYFGSGGVATGTTVTQGVEYVASGGEAIATTLDGAYAQQDIETGGFAGNTLVLSGSQIVLSGGVASDTTLSGGTQYVWDGAHAIGSVVDSGATQLLGDAFGSDDGGVVTGTILSGAENIYGGGESLRTTIGSSGEMVIYAGGTASGTSDAGRQDIQGGGTAFRTTILSGGLATVDSGGTASAAIIDGGTLEVMRGGLTHGPITFAGGGTLQLDASAHFGGSVASFGRADHLDLSDIAFGANTTVGFTEAAGHQRGVLTVSDGVHAASIILLGQYTAAQFTVASDGHGGSLISDPAGQMPGSQASPWLAAARH